MEAQVFGTKNSNETKKALRFFKERRIKVHFVDLDHEPVPPPGSCDALARSTAGEPCSLSSPPTRRRSLKVTCSPCWRGIREWLVTPLVRIGNEVAVGWSEDRWRAFLKTAQ